MLLYQITFKLYTSNSGINFLLYCISGQKFRNDLKEILCSSSKTENLSDSSLSIRSETSFVHTNASGSIPMKWIHTEVQHQGTSTVTWTILSIVIYLSWPNSDSTMSKTKYCWLIYNYFRHWIYWKKWVWISCINRVIFELIVSRGQKLGSLWWLRT